MSGAVGGVGVGLAELSELSWIISEEENGGFDFRTGERDGE